VCGRFTQQYIWAHLVALYRLTQPALNLEPHYNIAPTDSIDAVIPHGDGREPTPLVPINPSTNSVRLSVIYPPPRRRGA
jgi:putative SOS response-associated peptidase YedK